MKQVFTPGENVELTVRQLDPQSRQVQSDQRTFCIVRGYSGGFSGRGWEVKCLKTGKLYFLKVFRPIWVKKILRDLSRSLVCQDRAWMEEEVQMAILGREILADVTKVWSTKILDDPYGKKKPLIVTAQDYQYTWVEEFNAFGILMPFVEFEPMPFGIYSGQNRQEVKLRLRFMRKLYDLFHTLGAYGYKSQVMVARHEPVDWPFIYSAAISFIGLFILSFLTPSISWVWSFVVLYGFYFLSGSSWFSLPNVVRDKSDNVLKLLDADVGLPHVVLFAPTAIVWIGGMLWLAQIYSWSMEVTVFLVILGMPGYLHLYEWALFWENLKEGWVAPFNKIDTEKLKNYIDKNLTEFQEGLGDEALHKLVIHMEAFEHIQNRYQAARLDIFNRFVQKFRIIIDFFAIRDSIKSPSFSPSAFRRNNLIWLQRTKQITHNYADVLSSSYLDYLIYLVNCAMPLILSVVIYFLNPVVGILLIVFSLFFAERWRKWLGNDLHRLLVFVLFKNSDYRRAIWQDYKSQKMKTLIGERRVPKKYWQGNRVDVFFFVCHIILRKFLPARWHRLITDEHYRAYVLVYAITFNKKILQTLASRRFTEFLNHERDVNNISDVIYEELLPLRKNPKINGYVTLQFLILAPKVITIPAKLGLLGGIFATGGKDWIPGMPGWVVAILALVGFSILFKGIISLIISHIFNFKIGERILLFSLIVLPMGSYYAIPLTLEIKSRWRLMKNKEIKPAYVAQFWRLFGVRWQSMGTYVTRLLSMGSGGEGTILQVYFRTLLTDIPISIIRKIRFGQ